MTLILASPQEMVESIRELLLGRQMAELRRQLSLQAAHTTHPLRDVRRKADRAAAVVEPTLQRLANPDRRVGREAVALAVVELLGGSDEAEHALLHQVTERQALALVVARDRNDQAQVGVDQLFLCVEVASLDALTELDDLLMAEERVTLRGPEDLIELIACFHRVSLPMSSVRPRPSMAQSLCICNDL